MRPIARQSVEEQLPKRSKWHISARQARELARDTTDNREFEKLYPGYLVADVEAFHNDVNGGVYLAARYYRQDGQFIKPKKKGRSRK